MTVISQYDNLTAGAWAACSPFQLDNATENQKENENAPNLRFSRSDLLHQSLSWFLWHTLGVLDRTEKDASPSEVIHPQLPPPPPHFIRFPDSSAIAIHTHRGKKKKGLGKSSVLLKNSKLKIRRKVCS